MQTEVVNLQIWNPHANQLRIIDDTHRFKLIRAGRRFGKSTYAVAKLIEESLLTPDGLYFYIAPTYRQAKMIAWDMLLQTVRSLPKELVHKIHESELYVTLGNNSKIFFKGAEDPDALRGVGLDGCILDEYADIRPNLFETVIKPALLDKKGWCDIIGTPRGYNHFYELHNKVSSDPEWATFHFTSYDNPFLPKEAIDEERKTKNEETFAQEYLAEFRRFEGMVYKEFNRDVHVVNNLPERQFIEVITGVDFGYTNPSAMVVIGKDFDNHYWIIDEYYKTGKTTAELIETMKRLSATHKVNIFYPDPAEPDRILEMERAGIPVREVSKDIVAGVDRLRELFKTNRLHILNSCQDFLWELENYHYPPNRNGLNAKEDPIKEDDHLLDAARYALFSNQPTDTREDKGWDEHKLYGTVYN